MSAATMTTAVSENVRALRRTVPPPLLLTLSLLLIVGVPVADAFLPPDIHIAHLLVVGLAITAIGTGPRVTALIGALSVLALFAAGVERHTLTTESVLVEVGALAVLGAFLVLFTHLRDRRAEELVWAHLVSDAAQRVVLRPLPERAGPVSIASEYRSAEADTSIGGDLYAVARTAGSTRLIIGDVRGCGLATISDTAIVLGAFRAAAHRKLPLPELVAYVEDAVSWGLAEFSEADDDFAERFVTAMMVDIPDDEPLVHVISCGHPPPLRLSGATVTPLQASDPAPPLGLRMPHDSAYVPTTFPFDTGDRLLLYTDGVTEARNAGGVFYPLAERALACADLAPGSLVRRIAADVREYVGGRRNDDMAMIVVRRDAAPSA
ncbi:PP2C family protein-serine/threonine phosphatase [Streptomyces sp. NPDC001982]|uniref:PP2C family protein-serine/threonine phosphatase n=1 Tax=Streptomyces sp. NPDC001982 TaxID=3154405 RepID=UPI003316B846